MTMPRVAISIVTLLVFLVALVFKINFSSLASFPLFLGSGSSIETTPGLLLGTPRQIRSDEWLVTVPWQLSQLRSGHQLRADNPSVGASTAAMIVGMPTRHWIAAFRPSNWGFLLFGEERGFSWFWLCHTVVLFGALTLLFFELTQGSVIWALSGAIWIFFSSFTQWWLSSVSEMLLAFTFSCLTLRGLFLGSNPFALVVCALLLLIFAVNFAVTLYPPFQIPLAYLGLALLPLLLEGALQVRRPIALKRLLLLSLVFAVAGAVLGIFIQMNGDAIRLMESTVYPGHRVSLGGGMSVERYFGGFFDQLYDDTRFPITAGNICELSSSILLWPLSVLLLIATRSVSLCIKALPLACFLFLSTLWAFTGVPEWLAKITLWSYVPTTRAFMGYMVGGAMFPIVVAARGQQKNQLPLIVLSMLSGLLIFTFAQSYQSSFKTFVSLREVYYASTVVWFIAIALIWRARLMLLLALGVACVYPHGAVNPVMRGMRAVLDLKFVRSLEKFDSVGRGLWVVFGSSVYSQLAKAAGHEVINGVQFIPDIEMLSKLDPEKKFEAVYNRYAHQTYLVGEPGEQPGFTLLAPDHWQLIVDPCSDVFKERGVTYMVWAGYDSSKRFPCFERILVKKNYSVYKRRKP